MLQNDLILAKVGVDTAENGSIDADHLWKVHAFADQRMYIHKVKSYSLTESLDFLIDNYAPIPLEIVYRYRRIRFFLLSDRERSWQT